MDRAHRPADGCVCACEPEAGAGIRQVTACRNDGRRTGGRKENGMMTRPRYPSLYQINTRVRLSEIAAELRRPATLDDIGDRELDYLKQTGFDLVWFLGVWQTGPAGRKVSLSNPEWLAEYHHILPDFKSSD